MPKEDTYQPAGRDPSTENVLEDYPKCHISQENPNVSREEETSDQSYENWRVQSKSEHDADEVEGSQNIESIGDTVLLASFHGS